MKNKQEYKKLFQELELWSQRKDSFLVGDFLKEKGIANSDFEMIAKRSDKFMEIWFKAKCRVWENIKKALSTNSLPESRWNLLC
jgi:hypothetical protein